MDKRTVITVGDRVVVERPGGARSGEIETITVCLEPTADPAGEVAAVTVSASELRLPLVVTLTDGSWAYGSQITRLLDAVCLWSLSPVVHHPPHRDYPLQHHRKPAPGDHNEPPGAAT